MAKRDRDEILELARRLGRQGEFPAAIRALERLVEADPEDLEVWLRLGYLHASNRDREAAAGIYLQVAHAYERAGDRETAIQVLTQVLRLQPERTDAYFWLAELCQGQGRPAEARRWLEAVERQLAQRGRGADALRAMEAMVALDPGNVALLIRLGEAHAARGAAEDAVRALHRAADVLRMAEWLDDFVKVAERITYLDPADVALGKELATLYLRRRNPRSALRKLQRCYQQRADDPETLNLIVEAFMDLREIDKAITILEVLADLHTQRGEAALQEAAWRRILQLRPDWVPGGQAGDAPDTLVGAPPLELLQEPEASPVPLTTDELQLRALERSLQPEEEGAEEGSRFLPAVTAQHQLARGRVHGTTELELADLEEVAPEPAPGGRSGARSQRRGPASTEELDLEDVEGAPRTEPGAPSPEERELADLEALLQSGRGPRSGPAFRPAVTEPDAPVDRRSRDTQVRPRRPLRREPQ